VTPRLEDAQVISRRFGELEKRAGYLLDAVVLDVVVALDSVNATPARVRMEGRAGGHLCGFQDFNEANEKMMNVPPLSIPAAAFAIFSGYTRDLVWGEGRRAGGREPPRKGAK
jgi:hypothetical protein